MQLGSRVVDHQRERESESEPFVLSFFGTFQLGAPLRTRLRSVRQDSSCLQKPNQPLGLAAKPQKMSRKSALTTVPVAIRGITLL